MTRHDEMGGFGGAPMAHEDAMQKQAAERYVLGELSPAEREAYEEHFFTCTECAEEVSLAVKLADDVRMAESQAPAPAWTPPAEPKRRSGPWEWLRSPVPAWIAAAAMSVALLLQMNPGNRQSPVALTALDLTSLGSRALPDSGSTIRPPAGKPFSMLVAVPPDASAASYEVAIAETSGTERLNVPVTTEQARDTVQILVPPSTLRAGAYKLVIYAVSSSGRKSGISSGNFTVEE